MKDCLYPNFDHIPIVHATVNLDKFLSINKKFNINNRKEDSIILDLLAD